MLLHTRRVTPKDWRFFAKIVFASPCCQSRERERTVVTRDAVNPLPYGHFIGRLLGISSITLSIGAATHRYIAISDNFSANGGQTGNWITLLSWQFVSLWCIIRHVTSFEPCGRTVPLEQRTRSCPCFFKTRKSIDGTLYDAITMRDKTEKWEFSTLLSLCLLITRKSSIRLFFLSWFILEQWNLIINVYIYIFFFLL